VTELVNAAPLVRTQNSVSDMLQFRQVRANIAALGKAVNRCPAKPDRRQQEDRCDREPEMEGSRSLCRIRLWV